MLGQVLSYNTTGSLKHVLAARQEQHRCYAANTRGYKLAPRPRNHCNPQCIDSPRSEHNPCNNRARSWSSEVARDDNENGGERRKEANQPGFESLKPWCDAHARDNLVYGTEQFRNGVTNYTCEQRSDPRCDAN